MSDEPGTSKAMQPHEVANPTEGNAEDASDQSAPKPRRLKRRRRERNEKEEADIISMWKEIDENLERKAAAHELSVVNVKTILNRLIKDPSVIHHILGLNSEDGKTVPSVKLTRSKTRVDSSTVSNTVALKPVSTAQRKTFLDVEYGSDEDDIDYEPDDEVDNQSGPDSDGDAEASLPPTAVQTDTSFLSRPDTATSSASTDLSRNVFSPDGNLGFQHGAAGNLMISNEPTQPYMLRSRCNLNDSDGTSSVVGFSGFDEVPSEGYIPNYDLLSFADEPYLNFVSGAPFEEDDPSDEDYNVLEDIPLAEDDEYVLEERVAKNNRIPLREVKELVLDLIDVSGRNTASQVTEPPAKKRQVTPRKAKPTPRKIDYNILEADTSCSLFAKPVHVSANERAQIQAQLMQHLQLLTQAVVMSYHDSTLIDVANSSQTMINELDARSVEGGPRSLFSIGTLPSAILACHEIARTRPVSTDVARWARASIHGFFPRPEAALVMSRCPALIYPSLIPTVQIARIKLAQHAFTYGEYCLLALALVQFGHLPEPERYEMISKHCLPCRLPRNIQLVVRRCSQLPPEQRNVMQNAIARIETGTITVSFERSTELPTFYAAPRDWREDIKPQWVKALNMYFNVDERRMQLTHKQNGLPRDMDPITFEENYREFCRGREQEAMEKKNRRKSKRKTPSPATATPETPQQTPTVNASPMQFSLTSETISAIQGLQLQGATVIVVVAPNATGPTLPQPVILPPPTDNAPLKTVPIIEQTPAVVDSDSSDIEIDVVNDDPIVTTTTPAPVVSENNNAAVVDSSSANTSMHTDNSLLDEASTSADVAPPVRLPPIINPYTDVQRSAVLSPEATMATASSRKSPTAQVRPSDAVVEEVLESGGEHFAVPAESDGCVVESAVPMAKGIDVATIDGVVTYDVAALLPADDTVREVPIQSVSLSVVSQDDVVESLKSPAAATKSSRMRPRKQPPKKIVDAQQSSSSSRQSWRATPTRRANRSKSVKANESKESPPPPPPQPDVVSVVEMQRCDDSDEVGSTASTEEETFRPLTPAADLSDVSLTVPFPSPPGGDSQQHYTDMLPSTPGRRSQASTSGGYDFSCVFGSNVEYAKTTSSEVANTSDHNNVRRIAEPSFTSPNSRSRDVPPPMPALRRTVKRTRCEKTSEGWQAVCDPEYRAQQLCSLAKKVASDVQQRLFMHQQTADEVKRIVALQVSPKEKLAMLESTLSSEFPDVLALLSQCAQPEDLSPTLAACPVRKAYAGAFDILCSIEAYCSRGLRTNARYLFKRLLSAAQDSDDGDAIYGRLTDMIGSETLLLDHLAKYTDKVPVKPVTNRECFEFIDLTASTSSAQNTADLRYETIDDLSHVLGHDAFRPSLRVENETLYVDGQPVEVGRKQHRAKWKRAGDELLLTTYEKNADIEVVVQSVKGRLAAFTEQQIRQRLDFLLSLFTAAESSSNK